jgi:hypothetical protein
LRNISAVQDFAINDAFITPDWDTPMRRLFTILSAISLMLCLVSFLTCIVSYFQSHSLVHRVLSRTLAEVDYEVISFNADKGALILTRQRLISTPEELAQAGIGLPISAVNNTIFTTTPPSRHYPYFRDEEGDEIFRFFGTQLIRTQPSEGGIRGNHLVGLVLPAWVIIAGTGILPLFWLRRHFLVRNK